jgi:serine/threonine protein kinase
MRTKGEIRIVGTPDYIAPEILKGDTVQDKSVDIWALGVVLYQMLVGVPPFNEDSIEGIFNNIENLNITWPEIGSKSFFLFFSLFFGINQNSDEEDQISEAAYDLITKILTRDKNQRLGYKDMQEIKDHRFFKGTSKFLTVPLRHGLGALE